MERWMIVYSNMRWEEVVFNRDGNNISVNLLKKESTLDGKIIAENGFTKVMRIQMNDSRIVDIVDFNEIDKFFEKNCVVFKNREGLHREVRRYIDFSIK